MSNKKFSEFTLQTDSSNVAFVVGFNGSDNVRISPSNLIGSGFLPTSGGTMTGNLLLQDNIQVQVGTGADLKIFHNGTDSFIENQTGILKIQSSVVDGDISFLADNGSGTATEYFRVDGGAEIVVVSKEFRFTDNVAAKFGTGPDLQIFHDGTDSRIYNDAGDFVIRNQQDDGDIKFQSDDGSGGVTSYFELDGSDVVTKFRKNLYLLDNVGLKIGNSFDLSIEHDSSDSRIQNETGDLFFINFADDKDIIFKSDDGSGGTTEYFRLDGSSTYNIFSKDLYLPDNVTIRIGTGQDLRIFHNGTNSFIEAYTGNLIIQNHNDDADVILKSDDGSGGVTEYFRLDGGTTSMVASKNITFLDGLRATFGSGADMQIYHNSTNTLIENNTGNLEIINNTDDSDIIFKSDDGSGGVTTYLFLDGSNAFTQVLKDFYFLDNVKARFGDGGDLQIYHSGTSSVIQNTTGNLTIQQDANDSDIIFRNDDGSGGTTEYFRLDGSLTINRFFKNTRLDDSVQLQVGSGADLQISHDGTNSALINSTGNLRFTNTADDKDIVFQTDDGSGTATTYFKLDGSSTDIQYFKDLLIADNIKINVGNSNDLQIFHDGTDSTITNAVGDLIISNDANDKDIIFKSDTGGGGLATYFRLDGSNERLGVDAPNGMLFSDNIKAKFGAGGDMELYHDGSHSYVKQGGTGDLYIQQFRDDGDIVFQSDDGSGGMATYMTVDGSTTKVTLQKDLRADDGVKIQAGSSGDLFMVHESSTGKITNGTGNLEIIQNTDDGDIIFKSDDGSGSVTTYFFLDGSRADGTYLYTEFPDNSVIGLGNDTDLQIYHSGTNSLIDNFVGDLIIQQKADDKDILFKCDDGSGGVTEYFRLDGGNVNMITSVNNVFVDNKKAAFGDSADLQIYHGGSDSYIQQTGTGDLIIENTTDDKDIKLKSDDGSGGTEIYINVDGSARATKFINPTFHNDSVRAKFGNDGDLAIYHTGANSIIENITGVLKIQSSLTDGDISFIADDGSGGTTEYFRVDGGSENVLFSKILQLSDSVELRIGDGNDLRIKHDGTDTFVENENGDFYIRNKADDKDIIFQSDDGSGGVTEYLRLDGSNAKTRLRKNYQALDNVKAQFGDGNDLEIYHDGSNSFINDDGTGDLYIQTNGTNMFLRDKSSGNTFIAMNTGTADVSLRQSGNEKFKTTSSGVDVTGRMDINDGNDNLLFGDFAGDALTTGTSNIAIGTNALSAEDTGTRSVAIGEGALQLQNNDNNNYNIAIGHHAGNLITTGDQNTIIGGLAGDSLLTGTNNVIIGYNAEASTTGAADEITLGNANNDTIRAAVQTISSLSDKRDKTNIQESTYGLDFIDQLNPVTFDWNTRDGSRKGKKDLGFIAQELDAVDDEYTQLVYKSNPDKLEASYGRLVPILVKAIQELKAEIQQLKTK